ncbi:MAG: BirA family transcriptional regulator biotin operon repressor / biotin-acetyl-CoA-carboxylase ligase [Nitrospirae bacterium]|nr:MAG: BirA family transcriptional regulator biotin operon repressor / biotin-acetyl-CoA-carboxylase ligase [Nitrospirota bacterium]
MLNEIINMFKKKGDFVSGEEMSKKLGITRAAIWKKIKILRGAGYKIQATPAKGYKLIKSPEFSVEELRTLIRGDIGREIIFFESIGSTNTAALELAEKGAPHGTVVIADRQAKGKGRLGRTWVSPPRSNIYMSVILRPEIETEDATLLTIMAAVSCAKGVMKSTGLKAEIKWPNDLMISSKKLGGILTEMKSDPDGIVFAVIGIGINVNSKTKKDFPPDIRGIATSIREELGKIQSRTFIIAEILKETEHWYRVLLTGGRKPLFDEWKRLSSTLGRKVRVTAGDNVFTGVAEDIDRGGMLILRLPSGMLKKISSGDVTMLR